MAAFSEQEIEDHWPIWNLFQNGGLVLFRQQEILDSAHEELEACGYQVHAVGCESGTEKQCLMSAIVDSLGIGRYPNIGLDSFNDFISQIQFAGNTGVVISLSGFHQFHCSSPSEAFSVIDVLADNHRFQLLKGNRLLTLVQSDDPLIEEKIGMVGGYKLNWNSSEWFHKDRGL